MRLSEYARRNGIHYNTAYRMWRRGEIAGRQTSTGLILVDAPMHSPSVREQRVAVYARVSSAENRSNLDSQAERVTRWCNAKGWSVARVVKECGSEINGQRPKFVGLLSDPSVTHIVVEHKDRASRFGIEPIRALLAIQGRELVVVNEVPGAEDDLMEDFAAIITSFVARLHGRRRARRKIEQVLAVLKEESR